VPRDERRPGNNKFNPSMVPEKVVLLLALVVGALYLALVPPWQHYDEPTHFEYAWLMANRPGMPKQGDFDQAMRREVAASMVEHEFYRGMGYGPNLLSKRTGIGYSELRHPPFYYLLISLPLRLIRHASITLQLYVGRGVSLLLFILNIWLASQMVRDLTPQRHVLRWAVPGMMALLPGYIDLMTAINNDVGSTVLFSLFLWGAVRLILRGVTVLHLIWVTSAAALCVWTKNTGAVAVPLLPLAIVLALAHGRWRRIWWIGIVAIGAILLPLTFSWGDAAFWYRGQGVAQKSSIRQEIGKSPLGKHALTIVATPEEPTRQVLQFLPQEKIEGLQGQSVTLGAWMWADQSVEIRSPMLCDGWRRCIWQTVDLTTEPTFYAITGTVSTDADRVEVNLRPWAGEGGGKPVTVYYDGLVLVEEKRALDTVPTLDDHRAQRGVWEERSFVNCLRNGSAEASWPWVRPWAERALGKFMPWPNSPSLFLGSILDWKRTSWVYRSAGLSLLKTFWARFGWAHVSVDSSWYWGVGIATALGVLGALVHWARGSWSDHSLPWKRSMVYLTVAALIVWGNAFTRPHPVMGKPVIPVARYAFPAIIPTALALMGGWLSWGDRPMKRKIALGMLAILMTLSVVSLVTIVNFYRGG
jgi:hypothetical protein